MPVSMHYYTLTLGAGTNRLFEAFRDYLIDIEYRGFPIENPVRAFNSDNRDHLREQARTVDRCFGQYYMLDPLRLVVVGEREFQTAFGAVTAHGSAVIGRIEGDHTATSARDLGQIVWPVVKEAMSGVLDNAMHDLAASAKRGQIACGLEAVARMVNAGVQNTLLVEDGHHIRGSISGTSHLSVISPDVDVRDAIDDAVDAVIERVLASGGNVVFAPDGSLCEWKRMVLLLRGEESP